MDSYGKRLHKAARAEFRSFWSAYRYWLVLATLIAVVLVHFALHGIGSGWLADTLLSTLTGFLLSLMGTYVIAMRRAAEVLDLRRQGEISDRDHSITKLNGQLVELTSDPAVQHHYREAEEALRKISDPAREVLKHLWSRGRISRRPQVLGREYQGFEIPTVSGIVLQRALEELVNLQIVNKTQDRDFVGEITWWEIPPGFMNPLGKLLYTATKS